MKALTNSKLKYIQSALTGGIRPSLVKRFLQQGRVPARLAKNMVQYVKLNLVH